MANPELGTKQICPNCQTKFYDLTRRPAHCPKCGTDFDPEEAVRSRRVRARGATPDYDAEEAPAKPAPEDAEEGFEEADTTPEIDQGVEDAPVVSDEEEVVGPAEPEDTGMREFQEEDEVVEEEEEEEAVPFLEEGEDEFPDDDLDPPEKGEHDI